MYVHTSVVIWISDDFDAVGGELLHSKPGDCARSDKTSPVKAVDCLRPNNERASVELTADRKAEIDRFLPKPKDVDFVLILGPDELKWYAADYVESKAIPGLKIEVAEFPGKLSDEAVCAKLDERFRKWSVDEHFAQRKAVNGNTVRTKPAKKTGKGRIVAKSSRR